MFTHPFCGGQHSTAQEARQCEAQQGSTIVAQRPAQGQQSAPPAEATLTASVVPAGHYAIPSATGNNDLDFYRVDRPVQGRWKGYVFVKRVIGGKPDAPVPGVNKRTVLARIARAGVEEARARYGQEIGRCALCNRHLTDETSRQLGIGPECRKKV